RDHELAPLLHLGERVGERAAARETHPTERGGAGERQAEQRAARGGEAGDRVHGGLRAVPPSIARKPIRCKMETAGRAFRTLPAGFERHSTSALRAAWRRG